MKRHAWLGYDDLTYVRGDSVSSSRMGEDDMDFSFGSLPDSTATQAPIKASKSETYGATAGISLGLLGGTLSGSLGTSRSVLDVLDLNGDRYPDVVGRNEIQSTLPTGGMESWTWGYTEGPVRSNVSVLGVAASGSITLPKPTASAGSGVLRLPGGKSTISLGQSGDAQGTAKTMIGLSASANASTSKDECQFSWSDMNGDGLPDKVKQGSVWLNTGYGFLEEEDWGVGEFQYGYAFDTGLGGGISLYNGSIQAGLAISRTTSNSKVSIMDLTGDGLPEIIEADTLGGGNIRVQVNNGNGFEPPIPWSTVAMLDAGVSKGQSMNTAFTFCINLVFVRICINPNANYGRGASKSFTQFTDMDGDSYPDFLSSSQENDLAVYSSRIARTNLLRSVSSPFSAKWQVDFEVAGNTYELPQSKWVMRSLTVWDGFTGDGPDTTYATFEYAQGQYDRRERETYGFGEVRTHEWDTETTASEPYRTTIQTYDVSGYYTKGLPLVKTVQDGQSNKFIETVNTYQLKLLNGSDAPPNYNSDNDEGAAFPALVKTEDRFYEGESTAGITKTITFGYDAIGNVTRYADLGYE
ncbi:MAG TPA: toxin TcdB middle/N-terminal domain-containing protein, partial [Flavobacteriales bacterium]|nr:toxin TcdB middle/N-terminal domain-containing protein [Flavobacteriales bacterium]